MSTYAIAHVQSINPGPEIVEYLQRIDATLAPYLGRFVVHGDPADVREGDFSGDLIVIEFPDRDHQLAGMNLPPTERSSPCGPRTRPAGSCSSTACQPITAPPTFSRPASPASNGASSAERVPRPTRTCHGDAPATTCPLAEVK